MHFGVYSLAVDLVRKIGKAQFPMSLVLLLLVTINICFMDNLGIYLVINAYLPPK